MGLHAKEDLLKAMAPNFFYKTFLSSFLFLLFAQDTMAQNAEDLQKLPKTVLIQMAVAKIQKSSFDLNDFDTIEIWRDGDALTVEFDYAIRFIPVKGQFYYGVSVNLVTGSPAYYIRGEGPADEELNFYKSSRFKKEIQFVLHAINHSNGEVGKIPDGELPDGTMDIKEKSDFYDVTIDSESTHSYYKIKKGSGQVYDAGHKHYADFREPAARKRIY